MPNANRRLLPDAGQTPDIDKQLAGQVPVTERTTTWSVRVAHIEDEASGIRRFELTSADGSDLPPAAPGSHIDVHTGAGHLRQYSLCNGPDEPAGYTIAVKREPASRGGSRAMHDEVCAGDIITISSPRNNFPLAADAAAYLLIAGGIGVTPMVSMAKHLMADGRLFRLHYFVQSRDHIAFRSLFEGPLSGNTTIWTSLSPDETGERLAALLQRPTPGAQLYLCGPSPFMASAIDLAHQAGWPAGSINTEYFGALPVGPADGDKAFSVTLSQSGLTVEVNPWETIVEALARLGFTVPVSCEQGICGTCLTSVLAGIPDHRDDFLTDAEKASGSQMCLCVSRALSASLTLDL